MATPTPNGPTLNDLDYQSYVAFPSLGYIPQVLDGTTTRETVTVDVVGYTANNQVEDFSVTSENVSLSIDPAGPGQFSTAVSDSTQTSESMDILKAGARYISVSDSTVTSEVVIP